MFFLLDFLLLILTLLIIGSLLMGVLVGRRRLGPMANFDSLKQVQNQTRQQVLFQGLSPSASLEYHDSITISICFSRFALQVAYADGLVSQAEISSILHFFRNADPSLVAQIRQILMKDLSDPGSIDWDYNLSEAKRILASPRWEGFTAILFDGLLRISLADGQISEAEITTIFGIMENLGWSHSQTQSWFRNRSGYQQKTTKTWSMNDQKAEARQILGLDASAQVDAIKKRYRELVRQHHPDRYAQMGEEMQKSATARFQSIQKAYETLME